MFNDTNKNTVNFDNVNFTNSTPFSSFSSTDFEQVNVNWEHTQKSLSLTKNYAICQ